MVLYSFAGIFDKWIRILVAGFMGYFSQVILLIRNWLSRVDDETVLVSVAVVFEVYVRYSAFKWERSSGQFHTKKHIIGIVFYSPLLQVF